MDIGSQMSRNDGLADIDETNMAASKTFWNAYRNNLTAVADHYIMDTSEERTLCSSDGNKSNQEDENLDEIPEPDDSVNGVHEDMSRLGKKKILRSIDRLSESVDDLKKEQLPVIREATEKNLTDLVSSMKSRIDHLKKIRDLPASVEDPDFDFMREMNEYLENHLEKLSHAK